jgi:hypothetical protein
MNLNSMLQPSIGSHCKKGKENKERKDWGRKEDI